MRSIPKCLNDSAPDEDTELLAIRPVLKPNDPYKSDLGSSFELTKSYTNPLDFYAANVVPNAALDVHQRLQAKENLLWT